MMSLFCDIISSLAKGIMKSWRGKETVAIYTFYARYLLHVNNAFFPALLAQDIRLINIAISRNARLGCQRERDVAIRGDQRPPEAGDGDFAHIMIGADSTPWFCPNGYLQPRRNQLVNPVRGHGDLQCARGGDKTCLG